MASTIDALFKATAAASPAHTRETRGGADDFRPKLEDAASREAQPLVSGNQGGSETAANLEAEEADAGTAVEETLASAPVTEAERPVRGPDEDESADASAAETAEDADAESETPEASEEEAGSQEVATGGEGRNDAILQLEKMVSDAETQVLTVAVGNASGGVEEGKAAKDAERLRLEDGDRTDARAAKPRTGASARPVRQVQHEAESGDGQAEGKGNKATNSSAASAGVDELADVGTDDDAPKSSRKGARRDGERAAARLESSSGVQGNAASAAPVTPVGTAANTAAPVIAIAAPAATAVEIAGAERPDAPERPAASDARTPNLGSLERLATRDALSPNSATEADRRLPVEAERFVSRVEGALRRAVERDGRVQVRLSPPELGSLKIELRVQHGILTAQIEAESPTARNLLLDNLPALRERLAEQEIRIEKFDVEYRNDSGGTGGRGFDERKADHSNAGDGQNGTRRLSPARTGEEAPAADRPSRMSDSALDVRV